MEKNEDLLREAKEKIEKEPAWLWYKLQGTTKSYWNTTERESYFATAILEKGLDKLYAIPKITRREKRRSYFTETHIETAKNNMKGRMETPLDELSEPLFCQKLFLLGTEKPYNEIGWIMDFETPLYNVEQDRKDYEIDGIDLISYHPGKKQLILLESKRRKSPETLLRAVLEAFTYWKFADHQKLLRDFSECRRAKALHLSDHLRDNLYDISVRKAAFLFEGSKAYDEYVDGYEKQTPVIRLMKALDVGFYGIRECDGDCMVFDPLAERKNSISGEM